MSDPTTSAKDPTPPRAEGDADLVAARLYIRSDMVKFSTQHPSTQRLIDWLELALDKLDEAVAERDALLDIAADDVLQQVYPLRAAQPSAEPQPAADMQREVNRKIMRDKLSATPEHAETARALRLMADIIFEAEQAWKTDKTYTRDGHIQRLGAKALASATRAERALAAKVVEAARAYTARATALHEGAHNWGADGCIRCNAALSVRRHALLRELDAYDRALAGRAGAE